MATISAELRMASGGRPAGAQFNHGHRRTKQQLLGGTATRLEIERMARADLYETIVSMLSSS